MIILGIYLRLHGSSLCYSAMQRTRLRNTVGLVLIGTITVFILIWWIRVSIYEEPTDPTILVVATDQGIVRGLRMKTFNERTIFGFKGIPFAEPPVGNLRFAAPIAKGNWSDILDATRDTSPCPQLSSGVVIGDEDCLHLNVFTPQIPDEEKQTLLPVLVFIYGGAFKTGSNNSSRYGPGYLLDKDIVLVVPNYRVGPFGFLSTGDRTAPGNFGLKDQILALEWVRDNVAYFGGDPKKVTIAGQSAGGVSAHLLTLTEKAAGLFRGYITQSGIAHSYWGQQPRIPYAKLAYQLGEIFGCPNATSTVLVRCLKKLNVSQILNGDSRLHAWKHRLPPVLWTSTVEPDVEGALLPDTVENLSAARKNINVPWMNGVTGNEAFVNTAYFYANPNEVGDFVNNFDNLLRYILVCQYWDIDVASMTAAAKAYYLRNIPSMDTSVLLANITDLVSDRSWKYPVKEALDYYLTNGTSPTYLYSFEYRGTFSFSYVFSDGLSENFGAVHCDDTLYLFPQNEALFASLDKNLTDDDLSMKDKMVQIFTSFIINGAPSVDGLAEPWDPYSVSRDNYLQIGNGSSTDLTVQHSFTTEQMRFWSHTPAKHFVTYPDDSEGFLGDFDDLLRNKYRAILVGLVPA